MTIEQAAVNLSEAVKAVNELTKTDATSLFLYANQNGINIHVWDKDVFRAINSEQTLLDWHGTSREYCQLIKRIADVNFYSLIEVNHNKDIKPPIPSEAMKVAMGLLGADSRLDVNRL